MTMTRSDAGCHVEDAPVMGDMEGRLCFKNQANSEGWNPRISLNFAFRAVRLTIRINV
jgi:hypothetical protein